MFGVLLLSFWTKLKQFCCEIKTVCNLFFYYYIDFQYCTKLHNILSDDAKSSIYLYYHKNPKSEKMTIRRKKTSSCIRNEPELKLYTDRTGISALCSGSFHIYIRDYNLLLCVSV